MKVYVLMTSTNSLLGGCRWETSEYIEGIYSDKARAESIAEELQNKFGISYYDYERSYYVEEWEVDYDYDNEQDYYVEEWEDIEQSTPSGVSFRPESTEKYYWCLTVNSIRDIIYMQIGKEMIL